MQPGHWRLDRILEPSAWPPEKWRFFVILVVASFALAAVGKLGKPDQAALSDLLNQ